FVAGLPRPVVFDAAHAPGVPDGRGAMTTPVGLSCGNERRPARELALASSEPCPFACSRRRPVALLNAARDASARRLPPVPPRHRGAAPSDGDNRAAARAAARRARTVLGGHADR